MKSPPTIPVATVDANQWVCTRCKTVVPPASAPVTRRRSTWWSPRRGFSFGGSISQSARTVCGYCGSASLVPAGTPRGATILSAQGVQVTGSIRRTPSISCLGIIAIGFLALIGFSMCSALLENRSSPGRNAPQNDVINRPAASPVTDPGQQAREAAMLAEQTAVAQKKKADADAATFKFNHDRALSGNLESMYRLAGLYIEGIGCDKDTNAAIGWLRAAASVGHPEAQALLLRLQGGTSAPPPP